MNAQNIEVADKFIYLRVILETRKGWNKQKTLAKAKGYQALEATYKFILVTHSIKLQTENIYKMIC
jgi:hypothetical protein